MPQKLRGFPALAENIDSVPSMHVGQHKDSLTPVQKHLVLASLDTYTQTHTVHIWINRNIQIYMINNTFLKNQITLI